jgi:RNA 3'-terminal phosphate cyclase (ATP)
VTDTIHMDGRAGEGGGQILRTSLALSALTGRPLQMSHIRARRSKAGLLRQHLTAVRAAAAVCGAKVSGDVLKSTEIVFEPGGIRGGEHTFAVGTAGSAILVCQTVLPILLHAAESSVIRFEGGTHNPSAPPFEFLERVFVPMLRRMGAEVAVSLERCGFYPAGGGAFTLRCEPSRLRPLEEAEAFEVRSIEAWALFARLPFGVAERELAVLAEELDLREDQLAPRQVPSPGPGNAASVFVDGTVPELVTAFGRKGRAAEAVAADVVKQVRMYLGYAAPVGEHLADQLLIPVALHGGRFRTGPLSSHSRTNIETLRAFLGPDALRTENVDGHTIVSGSGSSRLP